MEESKGAGMTQGQLNTAVAKSTSKIQDLQDKLKLAGTEDREGTRGK